MKNLLLPTIVIALAGCSGNAGPDTPEDVGIPDLGAALDSGADLGTPDEGVVDLGPPDAGMAPESASARLFRYLEGRFDSADQSQQEPEYFDVQLYGCEVSAPELGERVLYIEQALRSNLAAPYRQRLYAVQAGADEAEAVSFVYELQDPGAQVGLCERSDRPVFTAADATIRAGCEVTLRWTGDRFEGGTTGQDCSSSINGATFATSEVVAYEDRIESWDRGYDLLGAQVWGAVSGAYDFVRRTELRPAGM